MNLSRRRLLQTGAAATGALLTAGLPIASAAPADAKRFRFCLNTSTIRGQKLPIEQEIELAGKAGYDGIEPWIREIEQYVQGGGKLKDLRKRIEDNGLTVESAIGFAKYIVDDEKERAEGLEVAKRDMDLIAQLGGKRIAAPPSGATREPGLDLFKAAERYRKLLEVGDSLGVVAQVEVWGFSKNLSRLGESMFVAIESGHPNACLLGDTYHVYKGGSELTGIKLLSKNAIQVWHMNDYPADPPRETINDSHRVYPGDGVAPNTELLRTMLDIGASPVLSLELFNKDYWTRPAEEVVTTGLAKMKAEVAKAVA